MLSCSQEIWDDNFVGKQKNKALKSEVPKKLKISQPNKLTTVDSVPVVERLHPSMPDPIRKVPDISLKKIRLINNDLPKLNTTQQTPATTSKVHFTPELNSPHRSNVIKPQKAMYTNLSQVKITSMPPAEPRLRLQMHPPMSMTESARLLPNDTSECASMSPTKLQKYF